MGHTLSNLPTSFDIYSIVTFTVFLNHIKCVSCRLSIMTCTWTFFLSNLLKFATVRKWPVKWFAKYDKVLKTVCTKYVLKKYCFHFELLYSIILIFNHTFVLFHFEFIISYFALNSLYWIKQLNIVNTSNEGFQLCKVSNITAYFIFILF